MDELMPPLYDVDQALKTLAGYRRNNNPVTAAQVAIADLLATNMTRHFPDAGLADAGTALVIAAGSTGALAREGMSAQIVINVIGFAGQRMVLDARAAAEAATGPADPTPERLAGRHADIELVCSALPIDLDGAIPVGYKADGTPTWGDPVAVAEKVLGVLDGRLLPEPVETGVEWSVDWHADGEGIVLSESGFGCRAEAEKRGRERIGEYGITRYTLHRREHRRFADHSSWSGPWVPADPPVTALAAPEETRDA
jgi:hypothetical protein